VGVLAPSATGAPLAGYNVFLSALMWGVVEVVRRARLVPLPHMASRDGNPSGPTKAST